jgi:hypothetical protein
LLAEIEYRGKSAEGKVRHPFFKGVREDFSGRTLLRLFCSEHGPAVGLFGAMRRVPCRATDQRVLATRDPENKPASGKIVSCGLKACDKILSESRPPNRPKILAASIIGPGEG